MTEIEGRYRLGFFAVLAVSAGACSATRPATPAGPRAVSSPAASASPAAPFPNDASTPAAESRACDPAPATQGAAPAKPSPPDVNGDGRADIALRAAVWSPTAKPPIPVQQKLEIGRCVTEPGPSYEAQCYHHGTWAYAGDLDGDGYGDAVVIENGLRIAFGGAEGLALSGLEIGAPASRYHQVWSLGDVDGDGRQDLLLLGKPVIVAFGEGRRVPTVRVLNDVVAALPAGDVDGDGLADLVITDSQARLLRGDTHRCLSQQVDIALPALASQSQWIAAPPGRARRAVWLALAEGKLYFYALSASATIGVELQSRGDVSVASRVNWSTLRVPGDLDGDGELDVVWLGTSSGTMPELHAWYPSPEGHPRTRKWQLQWMVKELRAVGDVEGHGLGAFVIVRSPPVGSPDFLDLYVGQQGADPARRTTLRQ